MINKYLKNPPIIEAVIGISVNKLFENEKEIESAFESSHLRAIYTVHKKNQTVLLKINEKDGSIIAQNVEGFVFSKENESLFLEKNRITLSDKNKYQSFEDLSKKYEYIWNNVFPYIKNVNNKEIIDIGIKFVNKFDLTAKDINSNKFLIGPSISLEDKETKIKIGKLQEFFTIQKIVSDEYKAFANVKTIMKPVQNKKIQCIFEIDVHDYEKMSLDFDRVKSVLNRLRSFKNSIFYANLPNAEEMEQFK